MTSTFAVRVSTFDDLRNEFVADLTRRAAHAESQRTYARTQKEVRGLTILAQQLRIAAGDWAEMTITTPDATP
jgi:hypothetical protein